MIRNIQGCNRSRKGSYRSRKGSYRSRKGSYRSRKGSYNWELDEQLLLLVFNKCDCVECLYYTVNLNSPFTQYLCNNTQSGCSLE